MAAPKTSESTVFGFDYGFTTELVDRAKGRVGLRSTDQVSLKILFE